VGAHKGRPFEHVTHKGGENYVKRSRYDRTCSYRPVKYKCTKALDLKHVGEESKLGAGLTRGQELGEKRDQRKTRDCEGKEGYVSQGVRNQRGRYKEKGSLTVHQLLGTVQLGEWALRGSLTLRRSAAFWGKIQRGGRGLTTNTGKIHWGRTFNVN